MLSTSKLAATLLAVLCSSVVVPAQEQIVNGDFETGNLTGWMPRIQGSALGFIINDGTYAFGGGASGTFAPINGGFDATSEQTSAGTRSLNSCFTVPSGIASATVSWTDTIRNFAPGYLDPDQEFRVYFSDPLGARLSPDLYSTTPGDPLIQTATTRSFDVTTILKGLVGQQVCLTFEEQDSFGFFHVSIDDVSLVTIPNLIFNGDFETGDLSGWMPTVQGAALGFIINDGTFLFGGGANGTFAPIGGGFDVTSEQTGPGIRSLRNCFLVPSGIVAARLSWRDTIRNFAPDYLDPDQEFRVYFSDMAGIRVSPDVFSTSPGDVLIQPTRQRSVDVTAILGGLVGQQVCLTFEEQDSFGFFHVSIDDVTLVTVESPIVNGGFETGDLTGWIPQVLGSGPGFIVNDGTFAFGGGANGTFAPIRGGFDATSEQSNGGTRSLRTCFTVPPAVGHAVVSWKDTIRNFAPSFLEPDQEFRVYFSDPLGARIGPDLFSTNPGDPLIQPTTSRSIDVTAILRGLVGQQICLTFEEQDSTDFLHVSIDDVRVLIDQPPFVESSVTSIGIGCAGSGPGPGPLVLEPNAGPPIRGTTFEFAVDNLLPGTIAAGVLLGFTPLGIDLTPFGATGCVLRTDGVAVLSVAVTGRRVIAGLPLIGGASLSGITLEAQGFALTPGVNPVGLLTSNALSLTIGDF